VLAIIGADPAASLATIATKMEWKLFNGEPNKMRVKRCLQALEGAKLIKKTRTGRHPLTEDGKKALKGEEK
jgi:repressor of nif and glnA expression